MNVVSDMEIHTSRVVVPGPLITMLFDLPSSMCDVVTESLGNDESVLNWRPVFFCVVCSFGRLEKDDMLQLSRP